MEQTPYNRSQEALDVHINRCEACKFINPIRPDEGLCEQGQRLYRRLRYYAAGNTDKNPGDQVGGTMDAQGEGPEPQRRSKDKKEIKPWADTLPDWRMKQIIPDHWQMLSFSIVGNAKLFAVMRPADYRVSARTLEISLSLCIYQDHEARRKWLEEVIRLELLFAVDKL